MGSYCAVFGCIAKTQSKHRFPNPDKYPVLFQNWIVACGRTELVHKSPTSIYNSSRVCRKHFTEDCFGPNNVLLKTAIPTLHLPEPLRMSMIPGVKKTLSIQVAQKGDETEHNPSTSKEYIPSTSRETNPINLLVPECIEIAQKKDDLEHLQDPGYISAPSTSKSTIEIPKTPRKGQRDELLSSIGMRKFKDLSPKTKYLYTKLCNYKRKLSSVKKRRQKFRERLLLKQASPSLLSQGNSTLDRIRARFFQSQVDNTTRPPTGHRFTLDDKIFGLALQKQSGSGYKFLSTIFSLPSKRTIQRLLEKVDIKPGINQACFELFKSTKFKNELDKYCVLLFDEMNIAPHLQYNYKNDTMEGFENLGYRRTPDIANHVQVFMLRGVFHKWKQPVYYNAVRGATKSIDIVKIIKLIVAEAQAAGLIIVATVCDQGTNNVSAIKTLIAETRKNIQEDVVRTDPIFEILNMTIIPLFDVPHLMKGVRNNFLKNDLCFEIHSEKKVAKWDHIYTAYKMDPYIGNVRSMPRITDNHVNPLAIKKMKVSCCTQVFSNSVAKAINLMAFSETTVNTGSEILHLPKAAMHTAELCDFFDQLFDSLNGSSIVSAKKWRKGVSQNSGHIDFWTKSLKTLKSMYFISSTDQKLKPPSLQNFISTLANFKRLFDMLQKCGVEYMMPRTFNQDPLENFFGQIRQRSYRYTNPTVSSFNSLYKSILVKNLTGKHSIESNCEDDDSDMFFTLKNLVSQNQPNVEQMVIKPFHISVYVIRSSLFLKQVLTYMGGYIIRKIRFCTICNVCKNEFLTDETSDIHRLTVLKEYNKDSKSLVYVNDHIVTILTKAYYLILHILRHHIHEANLRKRIIATLYRYIKFHLHCSNHGKNIKFQIFEVLTRTLIYNYTKQINNIMCGKDLRKINESDPKVFKEARNIYLKRRKHIST